MLPRTVLPLVLIVTMFVIQGMTGALAQSSIQVSNENGLLSVKASNTAASELAEALTELLGISVIVTGDIEKLININIIEEPLDKAFSKLSPNTMLVRAGKASDSDITEVILIMGDGSSSGSTSEATHQFLPSGTPTDGIGASSEGSPSPTDDATRQTQTGTGGAAAITKNTGLTSSQTGDYPLPDMFDPVSGVPINPITGLPLQQQ